MATTRLPAQVPVGLQSARGDQQHGVAIDDLAAARNQDGAVGIAVEGHADIGAGLEHAARSISDDAARRNRD